MNDNDIRHLRRCIELAGEARERGDLPFGSLLVAADGRVLAERRNEVHTTGDVTAHPELALASWASRNLGAAERAEATMYTSGEHCAMCAGAHAWAGIGRLVYAFSAETIRSLIDPNRTTIAIGVREVIERSSASVEIDGPCEELRSEAAGLFEAP